MRLLLLISTLCMLAPAAPAQDDAWAARVLEAVNALRVQQQLPPLQPSATLQAIAGEHSERMAGERRLSHEGFRTRWQRSGHAACVENVAGGLLQPQGLVEAWSRMPAHRQNLLEPRARHAGVAASGAYVTLLACR